MIHSGPDCVLESRGRERERWAERREKKGERWEEKRREESWEKRENREKRKEESWEKRENREKREERGEKWYIHYIVPHVHPLTRIHSPLSTACAESRRVRSLHFVWRLQREARLQHVSRVPNYSLSSLSSLSPLFSVTTPALLHSLPLTHLVPLQHEPSISIIITSAPITMVGIDCSLAVASKRTVLMCPRDEKTTLRTNGNFPGECSLMFMCALYQLLLYCICVHVIGARERVCVNVAFLTKSNMWLLSTSLYWGHYHPLLCCTSFCISFASSFLSHLPLLTHTANPWEVLSKSVTEKSQTLQIMPRRRHSRNLL